MLVVVYTIAGEVLLLCRTHPTDFWQSVTGSLRWGESPVQAARRELYEETGIMAGNQLQDLQHSEFFPIIPPWQLRYGPSAHTNQEHWFALQTGHRIIHPNHAEHTKYQWIGAHRSAQLASSWTNRKAIRYLFSI